MLWQQLFLKNSFHSSPRAKLLTIGRDFFLPRHVLCSNGNGTIVVEKRFSIDFCRQNKSIHQHQDSRVLLPAFILLSKLLCLLLDTPFCRDCDLIKDKSQCWKTAQKSRILIKIRMVVKKKMGQFIFRSQGNPNSIGKVDQRKEIERTSIGLNFSSRKKSKMSLLTRELAYSLLSHKTSVLCVFQGKLLPKTVVYGIPIMSHFPHHNQDMHIRVCP